MSTTETKTTSNTHSLARSQAPVPSIADTSSTTTESTQHSSQTSESEDTIAVLKRLSSRPPLGSRKSSGTMIVPHDHPDIELKEESFPPNDARAMSPKRSSAETGRMIVGSRMAIQNHAEELQSGLNALVEKVETIKSDHEKLEKNNNALQDYIGGLTRSMSRTAMDTGRKR